ncbi:tRNA (guanosine(37)-N1)-methyltransferase TrmD [Granulicella sibirica]|uniref:tRNA (guanine-N(1)-)-methyltransferase n=1 Tax=Granulicella sibirica TaxID=2479048 RepID=A0A4Q0SZF8_9BACT|nr:tRNA (guanosine(37)-N1)-methyltransferase TrmD [Granulicella sibirica]RXH54919.1 tRNA (Guanine37-N1) -methyltransferase [Granulicella sibirica]
MRIDILTIFPDFFAGPLDHGVLRRASMNGTVGIHPIDLRTFTHDRHRTVDDRPFGGGEGMLLKPEPIFDAIESLAVTPKETRDLARETVILLSPQGRPFDQTVAHELVSLDRIVLICGRYEGVDERVNTLLCDRELSIGDYVLSGGELAAAVIIDTVVRLLPGVLGNPDSNRFESFGAPDSAADAETLDGLPRSTHGSGGLLDYPQYTRPADFRGASVPEVLTDGNHDLIRQWRRRAMLEKTLKNRPDLLVTAHLTKADRKILEELRSEHLAENSDD